MIMTAPHRNAVTIKNSTASAAGQGGKGDELEALATTLAAEIAGYEAETLEGFEPAAALWR
jgi:hypothetical protein